MVDAVCEWNHHCLWKTPPKTPGDHGNETLEEGCFEGGVRRIIGDEGKKMIVIVRFEGGVDKIPFFFVFRLVLSNVSLYHLVLQFFYFFITPYHRQFTDVYYFKVSMPEGFFSFQHLMPQEHYQQQVLCIIVVFEYLWML
jgi:hypothetical protein